MVQWRYLHGTDEGYSPSGRSSGGGLLRGVPTEDSRPGPKAGTLLFRTNHHNQLLSWASRSWFASLLRAAKGAAGEVCGPFLCSHWGVAAETSVIYRALESRSYALQVQRPSLPEILGLAIVISLVGAALFVFMHYAL